MDSKFVQKTGRNVVITGASRGIGKAIAVLFAEKGYDLFISSKNEFTLYKTMEELGTRFPGSVIRAKPADLSIREEAIEFGNWCLSETSPDILINNAGHFQPGNSYNEPMGLMESQLAVNFLSAYHLTRTILPAMMQKRSGHVFNICSIASLQAYKNGGAYSISKFALHGFSKNLREEMKAYQVKVTSVHPGAVMTDSWEGFDNSQNRIMEPNDIAQLVYAASCLSFQSCVEELVIRPLEGDL